MKIVRFLALSALCVIACLHAACTIINDSSKINATVVNTIQTPTTIDQLKNILDKARTNGLKISIAGDLQSQGGQAFEDDVIVISMLELNQVLKINVTCQDITIQAGARWSDVIEAINQQNLSPRVMQDYNIFTVGGSISGFTNGSSWRFGAFDATVKSFRIMLYDGSIVNASPSENSELFYLAMGGMGLFGVITDATLCLTSDVITQSSIRVIPTADYPGYFLKYIKCDPNAQLHRGFLSVCTFQNIIAVTHEQIPVKNPEPLYCLQPEPFPGIQAYYADLARKNLIFKCLANVPGLIINNKTNGLTNLTGIISRNNELNQNNFPFVNPSPKTTDLVQEYFLPATQLPVFIQQLGEIVKTYSINLLSAVIRYAPASQDPYLNPTPLDRFGIQITFETSQDDEAIATVKCWTQQLISTAVALGGNYSLNYQLFATNRQIRAAYPDLDTFFAKKKIYDPINLFTNKFYKKYALCT